MSKKEQKGWIILLQECQQEIKQRMFEEYYSEYEDIDKCCMALY